jgi:23S rRNA U2552 (ribose-2'-O)-methylase RlmE/FtsJ
MHLDEVVRSKLKDTSISQAWLKMYEIITDCQLISKNQRGTFNSFHICEAPGTFINCINNYIHTKTKYTSYEWHSQSLNPKIARIKDQFGLIRRNPDRWDYGADQTGDITRIKNINYYKKKVSQRPPIDLMTSDCGLAMKEPGYEKVAFASLLAILHILPIGATMVYKILTPIDEPIILNLVYIAYCNFKELVFYKPVQNNHSREFYIIGKGYMGTEPKILEKFFNVLQNFKENHKIDLFQDKYPEAFVSQFVQVSNYLADNYIYTIERNIYYLDNFDKLTPQFLKLMKDYYNEKNQDWLDKYKPLRMDSDVDKL